MKLIDVTAGRTENTSFPTKHKFEQEFFGPDERCRWCGLRKQDDCGHKNQDCETRQKQQANWFANAE